MKRLFFITAAFLLALDLFAYAPVPVSASDGGLLHNAEEQEHAKDTVTDIATSGVTLGASSTGADDAACPENTVFSAEEFENWLYDHIETGGTVYFGCDIVLERPVTIHEYMVEAESTGHVIVDTNAYSLIYDGGVLDLPSFEITGEGVDVPVLDILDCGYDWFSYSDYNWNDILQSLHISATGRNGTGGVAVRVSGGGTDAAFVPWFATSGAIRACGQNAIGLYLDGQTDVYCLDIEVQGENSTAVFAPDGTTLSYCKLKADGTGARAASGSGNIVFDTCKVSPEPQNHSVTGRHIVEAVGERFYIPIKQYDDEWYYSNPYDQNRTLATFLLSGGDETERHTLTTFVEWDAVQLSNIDTNTLGKNKIQGILPPLLQGFGLDGHLPIELTMEVRAANSLTVSRINFYEEWESDGKYAAAYTWNDADLEKDFILWRSDDGGNSWYDFTHSPDIMWHNQYPPDDYDVSLFRFYYGGIAAPVTLQLEEPDVNESNLMFFHPFGGKTYGTNGGDRDGGDRTIIDDPYGDNSGVGGPAGLFPVNPDDGEDDPDGGTEAENPDDGENEPEGGADDGAESGDPDDGESKSEGGTNDETVSGGNHTGETTAPKTGKSGRSGGRTSENGNTIPVNTIWEKENVPELLIQTEPVELEQTAAITKPAVPENMVRDVTGLSGVMFTEAETEPDTNGVGADHQAERSAAEIKTNAVPAGQPDKPPRQYDMGLTVIVAACAGAATVLTIRIKKPKA